MQTFRFRAHAFVVGSCLSVPAFLGLAVTPSLEARQTPAPAAVQTPAPAPTAAPALAAGCARTWVDREAELEEYLRKAPVANIKDIPVGVTRPRRAYLEPGGPIESMVWKVIPPGNKNGFWESYKSEIAAYELNKLLDIDMIPPTVERQLKGDTGAAVMWASPTKSFKDLGGVPQPPGRYVASFTRQIIRAKMFDNLIANKDPNLGNWLVDEDWCLILIDHTRSFTNMNSLAHKFDHVDAALWDRMKALDEPGLTAALSKWLTKNEIKGVLNNRDRLQKEIDKLVASKGPSVWVR
jgi:hypothetical protein